MPLSATECRYPYEFSAHVPMLLRWPERWAQSRAKLGQTLISRGSIVEPPVVTELRDVFHTLVDAAGLASGAPSWAQPPFDPTDGKSMLCCEYAPTRRARAVNTRPIRVRGVNTSTSSTARAIMTQTIGMPSLTASSSTCTAIARDDH